MPEQLTIITGIFPPDAGGPAKFASEFGRWAQAKNLAIRIVTYADTELKENVFQNHEISRVSRNSFLLSRFFRFVNAVGKASKTQQPILAVGAFIEVYVASIIFNFNYIVKVPGDIVWERARNNGVTSQNIGEFQDQILPFKYRLFRYLFSKSLKTADFVIVPSMGLKKLCLNWHVPESKIKLIYNAVDLEDLCTQESQPPKYDLITVCRLVSWKGVDELIEYAAIKNMSLLVVGDGPDRKRLESLVLSSGARVVFEGEVPQKRVHELLTQSKVFVLNSYYEGLPHALVEARVAGLLTVGRAGTGSAEVINDDIDGFLIRSDRTLSETIDRALQNNREKEEFISRAKSDAIERFSRKNNYSAILSLIEGNF